MLQKLRSRLYSEEKGFTLIELLVVILIIGILAAIALPAFLGQRERGQDSAAKSDARNMVSELESCFATEETYAAPPCAVPAELAGRVTVPAADAESYTVTATSENAGQTFSILKAADGTVTRECAVASDGGCDANQEW